MGGTGHVVKGISSNILTMLSIYFICFFSKNLANQEIVEVHSKFSQKPLGELAMLDIEHVFVQQNRPRVQVLWVHGSEIDKGN